MNTQTEIAVIGGGCFWCTEAVFLQLRGVTKVAPGYTGGETQNPTYEQVCTGNTGHAEVIQVEFDPGVITYEDILTVFFGVHDPTQLNRQGNDTGTQYRSSIFTTSDAQEQTAKKLIAELAPDYPAPIVTTVEPLTTFYEAEEYHHRYFERNPDQMYCQLVVRPKIEKFEKKFKALIAS